MKKCKKVFAFTLSVLLAFACYAVPAFASSSASQYGLEATIVTDKESYKANEEIHVTVTVKNTNDFKVENVSIESLLPETLTLKDGSNSTKTVDLEPGETLTLSFTAVKEKEETSATEPESQSTEPTETEPVIPSESQTVKPSESESVKPSESETVKPSETETQKPTQESTEQPTQGTTTPITTETTAPATTGGTTLAPGTTGTQSTTGGIIGDLATTFPKTTTPADSSTTAQGENPDTGDSMSVKTLAIAMISLLSVIVVVIILMYKYKKQTTKIISLVMCVAVATTAITGVSFFTAKGVDDNRKSFTVEKVITVDGEETNVGAGVKYQENQGSEIEISRFVPSPSDVLVGEKTKVTFEATVLGNRDKIESVKVTDSNNKEIGKLYDNGRSPDKIAGDGIYSGTFELFSDSRGDEIYTASIDKVQKSHNIFFYTEFTQQDFDDFEQIRKKLEEIRETNQDKPREDILNLVEDYLKNNSMIESYSKSVDQITFTMTSGIYYIFEFEKPEGFLNGNSKYTQKKTAVLRPYMGIDSNFNNHLVESAEELSASIGATYKVFDSANAGYQQFKNLRGYEIILINTHGGFIEGKPTLALPEEYNKNINPADCQAKRVVINTNSKSVSLLPLFFTHYYADDNGLNNALVYLGACNGLKNNVLAASFLSGGAKVVLGYTSPVTFLYERRISNELLSQLARGKTVSKALEIAKNECGSRDPAAYPESGEHAVLKCVGVSSDYLQYKLTSNPATADSFAGGEGTINNPYQIANAQQLDAVRYNLKSNFVLVNDIDLSEYENWVPIGGMLDVEAGDGFQGTFDGKGHTIKNLKMDYTLSSSDTDSGTTYQFGLFSNTQNSPGIKNVNLKDVDIKIQLGLMEHSHQDVEVGTIVAYGSEITNCTATGKIKVLDVYDKGHDVQIGGICRRATQIGNCVNEVGITFGTDGSELYQSRVQIGGIIAEGENVFNCINKGTILCASEKFYETSCGGIVGEEYGTIKQCKNYGNIDVTANGTVYAGGIVGQTLNPIGSCINYGKISARNYGGNTVNVGGILGGSSVGSYSTYKINNCVNCGNITAITTSVFSIDRGKSYAGGIAGGMGGGIDLTIANCYNICDSIVSRSQSYNGSILTSYIARIYDGDRTFNSCYSLNTTTLNGSIPTEDIGPDQKNGGSMTKAEIEKAIQELGFELPTELPNAS